MTGHTAEHRVHVGYDIAQFRIFQIVVDNAVGRPVKFLVVGVDMAVARAEIEKVYLAGDTIEFFHIVADALRLIGKLLLEITDKSPFAFGYTVGFAIGKIGDFIHAVGIDIAQSDVPCDAQPLAELIDAAPRPYAPKKMHTRFKGHTMTVKHLKTTANDLIFLKHGDAIAFFGKDGPRKQSSQSATDDYSRLLMQRCRLPAAGRRLITTPLHRQSP